MRVIGLWKRVQVLLLGAFLWGVGGERLSAGKLLHQEASDSSIDDDGGYSSNGSSDDSAGDGGGSGGGGLGKGIGALFKGTGKVLKGLGSAGKGAMCLQSCNTCSKGRPAGASNSDGMDTAFGGGGVSTAILSTGYDRARTICLTSICEDMLGSGVTEVCRATYDREMEEKEYGPKGRDDDDEDEDNLYKRRRAKGEDEDEDEDEEEEGSEGTSSSPSSSSHDSSSSHTSEEAKDLETSEEGEKEKKEEEEEEEEKEKTEQEATEAPARDPENGLPEEKKSPQPVAVKPAAPSRQAKKIPSVPQTKKQVRKKKRKISRPRRKVSKESRAGCFCSRPQGSSAPVLDKESQDVTIILKIPQHLAQHGLPKIEIRELHAGSPEASGNRKGGKEEGIQQAPAPSAPALPSPAPPA